jgi:hypothetical protein
MPLLRSCIYLSPFRPIARLQAAAPKIRTDSSIPIAVGARLSLSSSSARQYNYYDDESQTAKPATTIHKSSKRRRMPLAQDKEPVRPPDKLRAILPNHFQRFQTQ